MKKYFLLFLLLFPVQLFAQITCVSISMADSLHVCAGGSVALSATVTSSDSILSTTWSPALGLSDTTILNPVLTSGTSGYRYLTAMAVLPANLVFNGNFSLGDTGFSSSYTYGGTGTMALWDAGTYTVTANPRLNHPLAYSFYDHTSGTSSGSMLAVNGASTPISVWCQTIAVTPGTYYDFSAWFSNWSSDTVDNLPIIQFQINGSLLGSGPFTFVGTPGVWTEFNSIWYSDTCTSINICIYDEQTAASGNDFAIDDIAFRKYCKSTDSIYVQVLPPDTTFGISDTSLCSNLTPVALRAPTGYSSYLWSSGATLPSVSASTTGVYPVLCYSGCHVFSDSIFLNVVPFAATTIISDTSFCFPDSLTLTAPPGSGNYTWQNGTNSTSITVTSPGIYYVTASSYCAEVVDSFHVVASSLAVSLGPDTTVCMNYPIRVPIHGKNVSYLWQDGSRDSLYSADHTGAYYVTVHDGGCSASDTVNVTFDYLSQNLPDTFICKGIPFSVVLNCNVPEGGSVLWSDGLTASSRVINDSGTWWVYVSKDECKILDTVRIVTGYCSCWYDVPSAFTPNNDGLNDVFRPMIQPQCPVSGYLLTIFNRWGEQVYSGDVPGKGWDGKYKGVDADVDVYMYYLQFFSGVDNVPVRTSGTLTLIR